METQAAAGLIAVAAVATSAIFFYGLFFSTVFAVAATTMAAAESIAALLSSFCFYAVATINKYISKARKHSNSQPTLAIFVKMQYFL